MSTPISAPQTPFFSAETVSAALTSTTLPFLFNFLRPPPAPLSAASLHSQAASLLDLTCLAEYSTEPPLCLGPFMAVHRHGFSLLGILKCVPPVILLRRTSSFRCVGWVMIRALPTAASWQWSSAPYPSLWTVNITKYVTTIPTSADDYYLSWQTQFTSFVIMHQLQGLLDGTVFNYH